jgi:hypothetical protein
MEMFREPYCRDMGLALRDCLDRAERDAGRANPSDGAAATAAVLSS